MNGPVPVEEAAKVKQRRMLDLFSGRWGWSKAFAARGWHCIGVDLQEPPEIPANCTFIKLDVLKIRYLSQPIRHFNVLGCDPNPFWEWCNFDFICASSPCEQFSVHGMKHFHPNPPYPELGIKLFNHTRSLCEASRVPWVMENVRPAQQFVGKAVHHCGPFYLWGTGVPLLQVQGVKKMMRGNGTAYKEFAHLPLEERRRARNEHQRKYPLNKKESASEIAQIPPELANCVADYAERLLECAA